MPRPSPTARNDAQPVRREQENRLLNIIVVGCGRLGAELAFRLAQAGHRVAVVDNNPDAFHNLNPNFRGRTLEGEVLNREVLIRAGIETADGLAAVTSSDSVNAVVGHVARTAYAVPSVIVRNYDPRFRLVHEVFGLQVISPTDWGAQRIEELLIQRPVHTVFSAGNGEVEIYELAVPAALAGRTVGELLGRSDCMAVAVTHAGRAVLPTAETRLEQGDVLHLSATLDGIQSIRHKLEAA